MQELRASSHAMPHTLLQVLRPEAAAKYERMSLGQYLKEGGFSAVFTSHYLLPMCAAVWSVPSAQVGT